MNIEAPKGMSIYNAVAYAKEMCAKNGLGNVSLDFNEINLYIDRYSLEDDITVIYNLKCQLRQLKGK